MNQDVNPLNAALIPAVITGHVVGTGDLVGLYLYSWKAQDSDTTTGAYTDPAAPLAGTVTSGSVFQNPALAQNNVLVPDGTEVFLRERGYVSEQMLYEFTTSVAGDIPHDYEYYTGETDITSANADQDVISIDLPDAGTYLIIATLSGRLDMTSMGAITQSQILMDVADAGTEIPGTSAAVINATTTGSDNYGTVTVAVPYTVAAAATITLRARWAAGVGATASIARIYSGTGERASGVGYVRLTNVPGGAGPTGPAGPAGITTLDDLVTLGGVSAGGSLT